MKAPAKLVLIRHAESERNAALNGGFFLNDPDILQKVGKVPDHRIPITEHGKSQAKKTSSKLLEIHGIPDVVFHSGYTRTKQTAEGVLSDYPENANLSIKEDLLIREREGGYPYTLLESEKDLHFPYLQDYWNVVGGIFSRPVGGESLMDVVENRLKPFLENLNKNYSGKTIFLVTHGRVIQCMRFILDEMSLEEMEKFIADNKSSPRNCSVAVYKYDSKEEKLKLDSWDQVYWE